MNGSSAPDDCEYNFVWYTDSDNSISDKVITAVKHNIMHAFVFLTNFHDTVISLSVVCTQYSRLTLTTLILSRIKVVYFTYKPWFTTHTEHCALPLEAEISSFCVRK